jgi:cysteinyl-tRNA synthetase
MEPAGDADPRGKRDPRDFALWKGAKADEPDSAGWDSPWGAGRPGWHIECSAMSRRYLGPEFDIHGGGLDLRFPHHENELAQSAAAGDAFARYWVHNGLVTVGAQKMSKSLFNFILADELLAERDPLVVRYALGAAHYRSSLDITPTTFDEAEAALDRIRTFLERAGRAITAESDEVEFVATVPDTFAAALDDDLNVPQALAVVHERVRAGNTALDAGDRDEADAAFREVTAMLGVLALDPADEQWQTGGSDAEASALDALVQTMIVLRAEARASKDWAAADRVRDALALAGIALEDTADGTLWGLAEPRAQRGGAGGAQPREEGDV